VMEFAEGGSLYSGMVMFIIHWPMACLIVPFPMTLDDLEGHSPNAGLIRCNSTNICATFSMVLTDTVHQFT